FDSKRNRFIELLYPNQLWAASNDSIPHWSMLTDTIPPALVAEHMGIVYEPAHDRLWLLGSGQLQAGPASPAVVCSMDLGVSPRAWVQHAYTGSAPFEGFGAGANWILALDPQRSRAFASGYGGLSGGGGFFALDLGDVPNWIPLLPPTYPWPPGFSLRGGWSMVYDSWHDRMLVYGGATDQFRGIPTYYYVTGALSCTGTPTMPISPQPHDLASDRASPPR